MGPRAVLNTGEEKNFFPLLGIEAWSSSTYPVAMPTELFRLLNLNIQQAAMISRTHPKIIEAPYSRQ
jgi:hypothetical protein